MPIDNITDSANNAHFDIVELEQVIAFIENRLISTLNNESQDLLEKCGGVNNFFELMYSEDISFLENISIDTDEFYDGNPEQMAYTLTLFSDFLRYSISVNRAYSVTVH